MGQIEEVIADSLGIHESQVTNDLSIGDVDTWDSMGHMILIAAIEDKLKVVLTGEEIAEMRSVAKIITILSGKI